MSSASPLGVVKDVSAAFVIDLLLKLTVTYSFKHVPGSGEDFTIELPNLLIFQKHADNLDWRILGFEYIIIFSNDSFSLGNLFIRKWAGF